MSAEEKVFSIPDLRLFILKYLLYPIYYYDNRVVITDYYFSISIEKNHSYITYIGENNSPEKVLLDIYGIGYYKISYDDKNGFSYKSVTKSKNENYILM